MIQGWSILRMCDRLYDVRLLNEGRGKRTESLSSASLFKFISALQKPEEKNLDVYRAQLQSCIAILSAHLAPASPVMRITAVISTRRLHGRLCRRPSRTPWAASIDFSSHGCETAYCILEIDEHLTAAFLVVRSVISFIVS